jgi:2-oxoglutarate ferredoxin oxidoreductase subunit delta
MEKIILHVQSCKSCGYCAKACPKKAITIDGLINKKGYQTTVVDENKCIKCGTCYTVCPDYVYEIVEV